MLNRVTARLLGFTKSSGHKRLFLLISLVWCASALSIVWGPLPGATVYDGPLGPTVSGCEAIVLDYAKCVARADAVENLRILLWRSVIVLSVPILLPFMLLVAAFTFDWVRDGYRKTG